jgi:acyl-coenzyme A thioesterase PaaI-like protein
VLTARARLAGGGRKLVFVQGEIINQEGRRLAHGDAVIKRFLAQAESSRTP